MQVGVAENQVARMRLHGFGMAGCPVDQFLYGVVLGAQEGRQLGRQRVGEGVRSGAVQRPAYGLAPARRVGDTRQSALHERRQRQLVQPALRH